MLRSLQGLKRMLKTTGLIQSHFVSTTKIGLTQYIWKERQNGCSCRPQIPRAPTHAWDRFCPKIRQQRLTASPLADRLSRSPNYQPLFREGNQHYSFSLREEWRRLKEVTEFEPMFFPVVSSWIVQLVCVNWLRWNYEKKSLKNDNF